MDDPTRWCENDTGNETRLPGLPIPSGSPSFFFALQPDFSINEQMQLLPS
jgi:hypothetical protein